MIDSSKHALRAIVCVGLLAGSTYGSDVLFEEGTEYARPDGESLKLNLARPAGDATDTTRRPAVICIHGGGFVGGDRSAWNDFARRLAENGYVAVTISYRLSPKHKWPMHIHDCRAAIRWLRANADRYGINPNRIGAMGSSAGGHLAQFLAVTNGVVEFRGDHTHLDQPSDITCSAAWSQASDFTREFGIWDQASEVFPKILGEKLTAETRRIYVRASPLFWATPAAAPSLIVHGTEDKEVLFAQSVWMYERLRSAEVETQLVPIVGGGHSLVGEHREHAECATLEFFNRVLMQSE
jgi:acetyl esterase/lipase